MVDVSSNENRELLAINGFIEELEDGIYGDFGDGCQKKCVSFTINFTDTNNLPFIINIINK